MLKRIVPTCAKEVVCAGGLAVALIANTSRSGRSKRTALLQLRPSRSFHCPLSNLTIRPVSGPVTPVWLVFGAGRPPGIVDPLTLHGAAPDPPLHTRPSERAVVWLPEWNTAA